MRQALYYEQASWCIHCELTASSVHIGLVPGICKQLIPVDIFFVPLYHLQWICLLTISRKFRTFQKWQMFQNLKKKNAMRVCVCGIFSFLVKWILSYFAREPWLIDFICNIENSDWNWKRYLQRSAVLCINSNSSWPRQWQGYNPHYDCIRIWVYVWYLTCRWIIHMWILFLFTQ